MHTHAPFHSHTHTHTFAIAPPSRDRRYPEFEQEMTVVRAHVMKFLFTGLQVHTDLRLTIATTRSFEELREVCLACTCLSGAAIIIIVVIVGVAYFGLFVPLPR